MITINTQSVNNKQLKDNIDRQVPYIKEHADRMTFALDLLAKDPLGALDSAQEKIGVLKNKITLLSEELQVDSSDSASASRVTETLSEVHALYLHSFEEIGNTFAGLEEPPFLEMTETFKEFEKMDRLMGFPGEETAKKLKQFISKLPIYIQKLPNETNDVGTLNVTSILKNTADSRRIALFKPVPTTSSPFNAVSSDSVTQRQVFAYLINRFNGNAIDVPFSFFGHSDENVGSVQIYRTKRKELSELSSQERHLIAPNDLHLSTVMRGRFYDIDAHLGNVLWKKSSAGEIKLTHIDWDFTLPRFMQETDSSSKEPKMGWRFFPQMDMPFSAEAIEHIQGIDSIKEEEILSDCLLPITQDDINFLETTTSVFKEGEKAGLTAGEIIDFLYSPNFISAYIEGENIPEALSSYVVDLKRAKKEKDELIALKFSDPSEVVYGVQGFLQQHHVRMAVQVTRKAIHSHFEDTDILKMLKAFQDCTRSNKPLFFNAIDALRDDLNVAGRTEVSEKLNGWIKDEF